MHRKCIACESSDSHKEPLIVSGNYDLIKCLSCGLKYISSRSGHDLPIDEYWDEINENVYSQSQVINEMAAKQIKYLNQLKLFNPPSNRLLDVGSGAGTFLNVARNNGLIVTGIEPSDRAVRLCKDLYSIKSNCGLLDSADSLPKDFGIITAWDVIEHVVNPYYFLQACGNHLSPNGILLLETPNEGCLLRKVILMLAKLKLEAIDLRPRIYYHNHRFYFTKSAITKLLKRSGFTDIKIYNDRTMIEKEIVKIKLYDNLSDRHLTRLKYLLHVIKLLPFTKNKQIVICRKKNTA